MLNLVYLLLFLLASPLLLFRMLVLGKYRSGWGERLLGSVPQRTSNCPCIWLHAVSVGEVLQLEPVLELLAKARPDVEFVISTTTPTGHDVATKKYPQCQVIYYPLDFTWAVKRALNRIRPDAIVLVELELWPNFIRIAHRRGIPISLINGRMSERSHRGYRWLKPLIASLLKKLSVTAVQNEAYADRLRDLAGEDKHGRKLPLVITGSIKFDGVRTERDNPKTRELRNSFGLVPGERVFVAGSTQAPEERFALETWLALRKKHPRLRLMLVPRHKERFEEVARLVEREFQLPLSRRSSTFDSDIIPLPTSDIPPVLLLDTLGELSYAWGLAEVAFVGGSLTNRGGQNMLEPAGYGAAVLFGPNTRNFRDIVESLLLHSAASVVHSAADLTGQVDTLLTHPGTAFAMGERARKLVLSQRGATERTVNLLLPLLPSPDERCVA